jgi:hypothetical protein
MWYKRSNKHWRKYHISSLVLVFETMKALFFMGGKHHGALAQLVGRGKRTFAPNQAPNPLPSSAEKLRLRSSALQQIRSADRHLKMPPGSRLSLTSRY